MTGPLSRDGLDVDATDGEFRVVAARERDVTGDGGDAASVGTDPLGVNVRLTGPAEGSPVQPLRSITSSALASEAPFTGAP